MALKVEILEIKATENLYSTGFGLQTRDTIHVKARREIHSETADCRVNADWEHGSFVFQKLDYKKALKSLEKKKN